MHTVCRSTRTHSGGPGPGAWGPTVPYRSSLPFARDLRTESGPQSWDPGGDSSVCPTGFCGTSLPPSAPTLRLPENAVQRRGLFFFGDALLGKLVRGVNPLVQRDTVNAEKKVSPMAYATPRRQMLKMGRTNTHHGPHPGQNVLDT